MNRVDQDSPTDLQKRSDAYFDAQSGHWRDLYSEPTLFGVVHQERHRRALRWIEELALPPGSRALDVGCGAGVMTIDLARRRLVVDAVDASAAMVGQARARAGQQGVHDLVSFSRADAHALPAPTDTYDLVVALGVLPFLHTPSAAILEMARVLRPGGHVILSSDNRFRLDHLVDPRFTPILASAKELVKRVARRFGYRNDAVRGNYLTFRQLTGMLSNCGFRVIGSTGLGFGSLSWLGWRPLPDRHALELHRRLQGLADRGLPVLRSTAGQHLVLAQLEAVGR